MIKKSIIAIAFIGLFIGMVAAASFVKYWYPNIGQISNVTLEVYINGAKYPNETAIDQGTCDPGATYSFENMTVVNTGTVNAKVYITTQGLPSDWTLQWQANNTIIAPGQKISGWLNLTIPSTATTWPNWGFWIKGEQA